MSHKWRHHRCCILVKYLYFNPCDRPTIVFNSPFYTSHNNNSTLFTLMLLNTSRQHISNRQTQFRKAQSWVFSQWQVIEELLMLKWSFDVFKYLNFEIRFFERWHFQTSNCKWPVTCAVASWLVCVELCVCVSWDCAAFTCKCKPIYRRHTLRKKKKVVYW